MDNRNIFLDLLLAAREKFFVSYSEGYEKGQTMPPSVVVDDFLAFVAAVTGDEGDRRAHVIEKDLLAWPPAHVRLALLDESTGPSLVAAQNRRGLVVLVAARPIDRPLRSCRPSGLGPA